MDDEQRKRLLDKHDPAVIAMVADFAIELAEEYAWIPVITSGSMYKWTKLLARHMQIAYDVGRKQNGSD